MLFPDAGLNPAARLVQQSEQQLIRLTAYNLLLPDVCLEPAVELL
jgi:hypothetical protein